MRLLPNLAIAALLTTVLAARTAAAQEPLTLSCAVCHGTPEAPSGMPSFYGRPAPWIAQQLRDFRSGAREGTAMPRLTSVLSDDHIESIARRFGRANDAP